MKKHIPILFAVLLLLGADYGGCDDEGELSSEYILVSVGAEGTVLFEENPGGNATCNSNLTNGLDVYIRWIKDGGETIEGWAGVDESCKFNSLIRGSLKLYNKQPIQAKIITQNPPAGYGDGFTTVTLAWETVYNAAGMGGEYTWTPTLNIVCPKEQ